MNGKIKNRFIINYFIMFIISIVITILALVLMSFTSDIIYKNLTQNLCTAESIMNDDYQNINTAKVLEKGGGVQVIDRDYKVVFSAGLDNFGKARLTAGEFTDFLVNSNHPGITYDYDIAYNSKGQFWLIVTFPTSIRIDFGIAHNPESLETKGAAGVLIAILLFYFLMLGVTTVIYSLLTSFSFVNPLKKLIESTKRLKEGDYSARLNLNLKNEFKEIQETFNSMAEEIEREISLRKQAEEDRKRLVLDISHDLKNPLASIMGYAELCRENPHFTQDEYREYIRVIYDNSIRANTLISDLFNLSRLESSEFALNKSRVDLCEYVRAEMGNMLPILDQAGFRYDFDIPEDEMFVIIDQNQMARVFQNLLQNTVNYNPEGTLLTLILKKEDSEAIIILKDNGIGIPADLAKDIFKAFVRVDGARNSKTGGTGLGLAIVDKIIKAHDGSISLVTDEDCGCEFTIRLPIVK